MDGKIIYILIIIAYGIYSNYAKSKKEAEKKRKVSTSTAPPPYASTPPPTKEQPSRAPESWQELIKSISQETKKKKQQVVVTQTASQKSQSNYDKKKKSVQERVFTQIPADEMKVDVMQGIPDEGMRVTVASSVETSAQQAYQIKEEETNGYVLNAREAIIQSIILNRPEY
ncbi:MAG: hypothetical protein WCI97_05060 [Bacteroidota bacterium]